MKTVGFFSGNSENFGANKQQGNDALRKKSLGAAGIASCRTP